MTQKTLCDWQLKASRYISGGMSSSFRANQFTGVPMYADKADGARFTDITGKEYIDFFMCHGAVMLGHNHPDVKHALICALEKGFFAGFDSPETITFAEKVCRVVPAAEEIRFVNSGSEGTLLALRLARGYTGKNKIIRIDGHFHGIHDYLLANNLVNKVDYENDGTRISKTIGRTAGIPDIIDQVVIPIPWNNIEVMESVLKEQGNEIGGIIMNVIDYNNGCFLTTSEYLQQVCVLTDKYNVVLIFDEVLSGFKTGASCGQGYYGVVPDICILGKALTNGVPMGIVAGKKEIMGKIMDPVNPVIAGGTFSGNQLGVAAGNAVMDIICRAGFYERYLPRAKKFYEELQKLFNSYGFPAVVQGLGAGFHIYIGTDKPLETYHDLERVDKSLTKDFFTSCIQHGLYFHTDFTVSAEHNQKILDEALFRFEDVLKEILRRK